MGTPNYMSPEQASGKPVDQRSDIFAVGAVIYETLVYRQAFPGKEWQVVLPNILQGSPEPMTRVDRRLDPSLEGIVGRAMARNPEESVSRSVESWARPGRVPAAPRQRLGRNGHASPRAVADARWDQASAADGSEETRLPSQGEGARARASGRRRTQPRQCRGRAGGGGGGIAPGRRRYAGAQAPGRCTAGVRRPTGRHVLGCRTGTTRGGGTNRSTEAGRPSARVSTAGANRARSTPEGGAGDRRAQPAARAGTGDRSSPLHGARGIGGRNPRGRHSVRERGARVRPDPPRGGRVETAGAHRHRDPATAGGGGAAGAAGGGDRASRVRRGGPHRRNKATGGPGHGAPDRDLDAHGTPGGSSCDRGPASDRPGRGAAVRRMGRRTAGGGARGNGPRAVGRGRNADRRAAGESTADAGAPGAWRRTSSRASSQRGDARK